MSLLREIQLALFEENRDIGPILLKLRFLASRLGSVTLEEWVKMEAEGFPEGIEVPQYRKIPVSYSATFSGPFGSGIRDAPIPPILIEKYAGKGWISYQVKQSIASIDDLVKKSRNDGGFLQIDASNLILVLQGKIYEDYACNMVKGIVSSASLFEIQNAVRSKIMELTIEIEKSIPQAHEITINYSTENINRRKAEMVKQITNHIVYGNVTTVNNSGDSANFDVKINSGDVSSITSQLVERGIAPKDAADFLQILESEAPESAKEPFGEKAKKWIASNIVKAVDGTWKAGVGVATDLLKEAALRYYGLK